MPASKGAPVEPSITSRVFDVLIKYDGFLNLEELSILLEVPKEKLRAALWWLQKARAVEAVDVANTPFWFATPGQDIRSRTVDEKRVEDEPRKTRGRRRARTTKPNT